MTSKRLPFVLILLVAGCSTAGAGADQPPAADSHPTPRTSYDLLIVGGDVVDGTGSPGVRANVAITGDRIAAVGPLAGATARDTIDATGLVVSPGFIDMLGHSEHRLLADPRAMSKITQGITSEITGEVYSVVPVNERTLEELEDEFRPFVTWTDLDGYFGALERARPAINLGTFVTAGSVRRYVMGDTDRAPTEAELARMEALVDSAMRQGAMGLSTGLAYTPASFATTDELVRLTRAAARHGGGYASHIRSEGGQLVPAIEEAIAIGERAGTWAHVHHLKSAGRPNWGRMPRAVQAIEAARARGVDVTADIYPYTASGTDLSAVLPSWVHVGGTAEMLSRLRDPASRARLRTELGSGASIGASTGGPGGVMIASVGTDSLRRYQGMRLDAFAAQRGQPVPDAVMDLLLADRGYTAAIYFSMSEDDLELAMRQPWVSVGTDGGARATDSTVRGRPHPRVYGTFPRILCRYVRERRVLTVEEAVRRFTSLPASRVGLRTRGIIRAGMHADLTLFDPASVCDRATFDNPIQPAVGIPHVIVNGIVVVRDGMITGERPGRGLRREPRPSAPSETSALPAASRTHMQARER